MLAGLLSLIPRSPNRAFEWNLLLFHVLIGAHLFSSHHGQSQSEERAAGSGKQRPEEIST